MDKKYDVIIIGAGFAGVTAARELCQAGFSVLILEGRDRMGGRTWLDDRFGSPLEMGGGWLHWHQPHIWSEIMRYGLEVSSTPKVKTVYWMSDETLHQQSVDDWHRMMEKGMHAFLDGADRHFPFPYNPLKEMELLLEVDSITAGQKLEQLMLPKELHELIYSIWSLQFSSTLEEVGLTQAHRLAALVNYDWKLVLRSSSAFKIKQGTKTLIEHIFHDAKGAHLQFSTTVSNVKKVKEGYIVSASDGSEVLGRAVIAAIPLNVLNKIAWMPPLSLKKQEASAEKQNGKGFKFWARVRGIKDPFIYIAPANHQVNYIQVEEIDDEVATIVGFGCDASNFYPEMETNIGKEMQAFLPQLEILELAGHDWVADPFSNGTWAVLKKNQLTKYLAELQRNEDGVFLAGSDYASGWAGFMDGAIESGITIGRKVSDYLLGN
ncbi:NAD(P)/FAD-dependent oxidoreductase [Bacillus sp. FJAT-27251]|uniref:flavin monoamine oxidase family protein n=1 Tax=Bacillus sp. FJAT-27251 TaxID=1684142 RepID=UPI0006A75A0F|nr:NAD(P)/FAD-dependent oxidoreductase [Bacillus sp. FJAT-27251]